MKYIVFAIIILLSTEAWVGGSNAGRARTNDDMIEVVYGSEMSMDFVEEKDMHEHQSEFPQNTAKAKQALKKLTPYFDSLKKKYKGNLTTWDKFKDKSLYALTENDVKSCQKEKKCIVSFGFVSVTIRMAFAKLPDLKELEEINEALMQNYLN